MPVNKEMLKGAHATADQTVAVVLEVNTTPCMVEVPDDMTTALANSHTTRSSTPFPISNESFNRVLELGNL